MNSQLWSFFHFYPFLWNGSQGRIFTPAINRIDQIFSGMASLPWSQKNRSSYSSQKIEESHLLNMLHVTWMGTVLIGSSTPWQALQVLRPVPTNKTQFYSLLYDLIPSQSFIPQDKIMKTNPNRDTKAVTWNTASRSEIHVVIGLHIPRTQKLRKVPVAPSSTDSNQIWTPHICLKWAPIPIQPTFLPCNENGMFLISSSISIWKKSTGINSSARPTLHMVQIFQSTF